MDLVVGENSAIVRAGKNSERAIVEGGIVEVDTDSENLLESVARSVCVCNGIFNRPRTPAWRFSFFAQGKCRVLMPDDKPVGIGRLVEEGGMERERVRTENVSCDLKEPYIVG
jgi:hypothetical protein